MRVRSAHAGGHHACSSRTVAGPFPQLRVHVERRGRKVDLGIGLVEVETRRQLPVLERKDGLDHAGDRRRGVEMPDIGFDRADGAVARTRRKGAERLGQRPDLNRIPDGRSRAVCLDVADAVRLDAGIGQRFHDGVGLAVDAGRRVTGLFRAIVVDRRTLDHGMNGVAVREGVRQSLQHQDAAAAAEHRAIGSRRQTPARARPARRTPPASQK